MPLAIWFTPTTFSLYIIKYKRVIEKSKDFLLISLCHTAHRPGRHMLRPHRQLFFYMEWDQFPLSCFISQSHAYCSHAPVDDHSDPHAEHAQPEITAQYIAENNAEDPH